MSGGHRRSPSPLSDDRDETSAREPLDGRERLPVLDESTMVDERSIRRRSPATFTSRLSSRNRDESDRINRRMSPSPTPGGNSPFLTDVELDDRSSWNRPGSRNSMYEYNSLRPFSRQSVGSAASCHSFRSVPVVPLGAIQPLWAAMPTHRKRHIDRQAASARNYGKLPTGTSHPASFSGLMSGTSSRNHTPFNKTPEKPQMPRLIDVTLHEDGHSRSVGLQAAPCMWTRFFFETSQQDSDMSTSKTTPTFQHFDVTFQPDPLGGIDMSGKSKKSSTGGRTNAHASIREWIQRSHESVYLVTQILPPDTFVDTENVENLQKSGETTKIWPLPACEEQRDPNDLEQEEMVSLMEYTRTVCRMEPRSGDDSRQLIKLQRGVLTAVVTLFDTIEDTYEKKFKEKSENLKKVYEEWSVPIEAENARLKAKMAEFEAMQERLRYMDQLEKEMAEQKTVLHQTQDALQDALAKLAELKDMEAKSKELESTIEDLTRQLAQKTKELGEEKSARMALKFELATLKKLLAAAKNADELQKMQDEIVRLQMQCNEQEVVINGQNVEIERLQKLLDTANEKIKDLEALVKQYEEAMEMQKKKGDLDSQEREAELERIKAEMQELQQQLEAWQAKAKAASLHARVLGGMVARAGHGELAPCSIPPKATAVMPEGYMPYGAPVEIMLHKDTIVKLPEEKARADGSLETPRHKLLKPGEECRVADMDPISEPTDAQLKIMADCLDGQDPTDYTWVKVPMGVTFTNEGNYEVPHKALLVPGTTIVMQVDSTIEAPPASSIGVTNSSKTGLPIRLPKAATLSLDGIENQVQPQSDPDGKGLVKYSLPDGTGINLPEAKGPAVDLKLSLEKGSILVVPPEPKGGSKGGSKIGNRLSGFSFARKNCFWCRMRMLGKDMGDDDDDEDVMIMPVTPLPAEPRDGGLVGFKNAAMECNEDCGTFRVPVSRTQGSQGPVEIEITTMDGSANEIVDYIPPKNKLLRWEDGDTEDKFIEIGIIDDDFTTEGDETFHICIEGLLDGDVGIGTQKVTITIKDIPRERAAAPTMVDHQPTELAWEAEGFREMVIPPSWKKLLGKAKVDGAKMMAADKARKLVTALYDAKRNSDKIDDKAGNSRAAIAPYSAEFFKNHWGVVGLGKKLAEFLARLRYEYRRKVDVLVNQYTCLCGIYDRQPQVAHYIIVKGHHIAASLCSSTGCNPGMFWNQLNKGKSLTMKALEAHAFLDNILTNKDQNGNPFVAPEVDMDECHQLLNNVMAKEAERGGPEGAIPLDRLMSFAISTILWLNKKAAPRITEAFKAEAGPDGTLDFDAFKSGLRNVIAWNDPTTECAWDEALTTEGEGASRVKIASCIAAVNELHDVVAFSSVS